MYAIQQIKNYNKLINQTTTIQFTHNFKHCKLKSKSSPLHLNIPIHDYYFFQSEFFLLKLIQSQNLPHLTLTSHNFFP